MRKYIILMIIFMLFKHGFSQDKGLKIDIPNQGFVGSDITVRIEYPTDFEFIISQIEGVKYITATEKTVSVTQDNQPETRNYYIKELNFRCLKEGLIDIPQITVIANSDTILADSKKIYIIDLSKGEQRDSSFNNKIVFINRIQEYIEDEDILIDFQYNKNKLHVNDTLTVNIKLFTRLENQIQPIDILNLRQENLKLEFIPQQTNDEQIIIKGLLYRQASSFNIRMIPTEKGYYSFTNVLISLKLSLKKGKSIAYLLPKEYKEINVKVKEFDFKAKK